MDIPSWVKTNAVWWGEGQISDLEFVTALQFLITNGHLKVGNTSEDVKILEDKLESSKNLKNKYQQHSIELTKENKQLQDDIKYLESENKRLSKTIDSLLDASASPPTPSYKPPIYNEIRYDVDDLSNIGGLNVGIHSFGFLEPESDEFSIDLSITYTRGGNLVGFDVSQIKVTTDDHFSFDAEPSQFLKLNGYYSEDKENRAIIQIDDVPRDLEGNFEILVLVREFENNYYVQDYVFTFPYDLQ